MERESALKALLSSFETDEEGTPRSDHQSRGPQRSQLKDKSQKRKSTEEKNGKDDSSKKPKPEEEKPSYRPDFSAKPWRSGEMRIVNADGVSIIKKHEWADRV
jgi:hypothetical protein